MNNIERILNERLKKIVKLHQKFNTDVVEIVKEDLMKDIDDIYDIKTTNRNILLSKITIGISSFLIIFHIIMYFFG